MSWRNLFALAQHLCAIERPDLLDVGLRRSISTSYYAMFHCLGEQCADLLAGPAGDERSEEAWRQTYRALEHGHAVAQCKNKDVIRQFPETIRQFANQFIAMQEKRHEADYSPNSDLTRSGVSNDIRLTLGAVEAFCSAPDKDRRAFCILVLLRARRKGSF